MDDVQETTFSVEVAEAVAAVALMAAFADGSNDREEQARLEDIFTHLGGVSTATLY